MSAEETITAAESPAPSTRWLDLTAIVVCTLAWGTTWYAITHQLGVVDPVVSVTYRFTLAAVLLFVWCALRRERIALTRAQHAAAFGVGLSTFAINYALVYFAEQWVTSRLLPLCSKRTGRLHRPVSDASSIPC
jgi:drug/metabolite transporter (DMT)-like permease